jgi:Domain of unknown function (DUF6894)
MRLFFHLTNGSEVIVDDDGLEVAHLDEVRKVIAADLEELKREIPLERRNGWRLEVTDQAGEILVSVPLSGFD